MNDFLEVALDAANDTASFLKKEFGGFIGSQEKESFHSIFTKQDLKAESIIINKILAAFPDHGILSEETGSKNLSNKYMWVIDPIDGSSYFARGIPSFCISISLVMDGEVVVGVVHHPIQNEIFSAVKNEGARLNDVTINVSSCKKLNEGIGSFGHRLLREDTHAKGVKSLLRNVRSVRAGGSCAMELCQIAAGRMELMATVNQSAWDYAAGKLILEEAGGSFTNFSGNQIQLSDLYLGKTDIVASNKHLHTAALSLLQE